jgi:hypothetical protein
MKLVYLFPFVLLATLACQKPNDVTPSSSNGNSSSESSSPAGTSTEIGQPTGESTTKLIGPAGGTILLFGGKSFLTIPAGAVAKETSITIQPVENKAFGGAGTAYEITPKDLQLQKEATLTWQYTSDDIEGSAPEALGLAYQDKNGIWRGRTDVKIDKTQKTASAPVSHLAHWAFYEQFHINVDKKTLAPTEQAKLTVYYQEGYQDSKGPNDPSNQILLTPEKVVSASRVVRWTINGVTAGVEQSTNYATIGQITEDRTHAQATYDAPPREPDTNPVIVAAEVDLKQWGRLILTQPIRVESSSLLKVGGATDANPNVSLTMTGNELRAVVVAASGVPMVSFIVYDFKGKGTYTFPEPKGKVNETIAMLGYGNGYSQGYYVPETGAWVSGNVTLTISEHGGNGKPTKGTLSGSFYNGPTSVPVQVKFKSAPVYVP